MSRELDGVLVAVEGRTTEVPEFPLPPGVGLRTMDPADPTDVEAWLAVTNPAFERLWTAENHRLAMAENPVVVVERTFLAVLDGDVVATASAARFRGNPEVGAGHYLAVHPSARGRGLALALCSTRYRHLADLGVEVAESQTHLHRVGSLHLHFRCGFRPKTRVDAWNSLEPPSGPVRSAADAELAAVYADWRAAR